MKKFLLSIFAVLFAFAGAQAQTWTKVTDASTLKAGDQLVIACDSKGFVAGDITSQYLSKVAATFAENTISSLPADAVVLTLGGTSGAWTLSNENSKLLGATAVKKVAWGSGTTTWSISIEADGNATIQNGTSSYGRFLYNVNSPRFTTYTSNASSSMLLPQLYRLEVAGGEGEGGDEETPAAPTLPAACNFDDVMTVEITGIAADATVYYTTDESDPATSDTRVEYTEPFDIIATTTVKAIAVNEGGSSEVVSATYTKIEPKTIKDVIAAGAGEAMTTGTVVATYSRGFLLGDGTAYILVYQGLNPTNEFSAGDVVSISGPVSKYGGLFQFGTATVIDKTGEAELTHPEVTTMDGAAMDAYLSEPSIQYVEYTGVLTISGNFYNVAVEGAKTAIGSIQYPKEGVIEAKDKDVVKVTGYTISISNSDNEPKYVNTMAVKVEVVEGGITEPEEPETPVDGPSWTLVEKVSDINAGDEVIIAYNNYGLGAKSNTSTVYHTKVDIKTTNDGKALTDIGEAKVLTVGKNGDSYTFSYDGNYLYWSSGNSLSTNVSVSDNSSWTIAIDKGEATISNKKDNTRKLQYNASSPRFACYTGTQQNVRIYKKVETSLTSYTLSVTDAGYATLFLDFAAAIPEDVEVYTVTAVNTGSVTLTPVTGVLPANTGVIVKAGKGDYNFVASTVTPATVTGTGNLLQGTVAATEINVEAYVLGNVDGVGLYKAKMTDGKWLNNANKAYLPATALTAGSDAPYYSFRFGEGTTGIDEITDNREQSTVIYDLTGRRVEEVTAPGIYIVNGKKVLVK